MKLEILLSIMDDRLDPKALSKDMNIDTDMTIVNQCNKTDYAEFTIKNNTIRTFYFNERGLSKSRNEGLMRIKNDIAIFADDGEKFVKNYEKIIIDEFKTHPAADIIIFNETTIGDSRKYYQNKKWKRIRKYNCLRYGSTRIAFRHYKIQKNNIFMNTLLGAGAKYQSGEDSVFLFDCLRKGLKIYASPKYISTVDRSSSSWFNGYSKDYYYKKGAVFYCLYKKLFYPYIILFSIKHRHDGILSWFEKSKLMTRGALEYMKSERIH